MPRHPLFEHAEMRWEAPLGSEETLGIVVCRYSILPRLAAVAGSYSTTRAAFLSRAFQRMAP